MGGNTPVERFYPAWLSRLYLLLLIVLLPVCPALAQEAGAIISLLGTAEVWREGRWRPAGPGEALAAGEAVRTGEGSRVAILLANGTQLKLNANSRLELKEVGQSAEGLAPAAAQVVRSILRVLGVKSGCATAGNRWKSRPCRPPPPFAAPSLTWRWAGRHGAAGGARRPGRIQQPAGQRAGSGQRTGRRQTRRSAAQDRAAQSARCGAMVAVLSRAVWRCIGAGERSPVAPLLDPGG